MRPPAPPAARALRAGPHLTHCKSQMSTPGREHDDSRENGKRPALSCFRAGYSRGGPVGAEGEVGSLFGYWLSPKPSGDLPNLLLPLGNRATRQQPCHLLPLTQPCLHPLLGCGPRQGSQHLCLRLCPHSPLSPCSFHSLSQLAFRWDRGGHFLFFFPNNSRSLL